MAEESATAGASRRTRLVNGLSLLFCAAVAALYVSPTVLDPDEAIVAAIARRMIDFGLPVYDAGWDPKPPVLFWIYRALFACFGTYAMVPVHVASAVAWVATAAIVGVGAAKLLGPRGFAPAVVAYALLRSVGGGFAGAANFEAFMSPFLASGLLLLLVPDARVRTRVLGGAALALAVALKPPVVLYALPVLATNALLFGGRAAFRTAWAAALGAAVTLGLFVAVLAAQGDLSQAWTLNVEIPRIYMAHGRITEFGARLAKLGSHVAGEAPPWILAGCGIVAALAFPPADGDRRAVRRWALAGTLFLATGAYLVTQGGYFFRHYWWMVHPVFAVAVAAGWTALTRGGGTPLRVWGGRLAAAAILLAWGQAHRTDKRHLLRDLRQDRFGAGALAAIADEVRRHSGDGDAIFVWGWNPQLYVAADRVAATRFAHCDFLSGSVLHEIRTGEREPRTDVIPGAWDRLLEDLERTRPRVIVDTTDAAYFAWRRFPVERFPRLREHLAEHYELVAEVEGYDVHRRRRP